MKRLLPALLALTLLSGCGASTEETVALPPETVPFQSISAPAEVTEGREPEEGYDLSAALDGLWEWMHRSTGNQDSVGLLAELPEQDAALYGVRDYRGDDRALLRWGGSLAEFDWSFGGPQIVEPRLWCWDVDDDGQDEIVLVNYIGGGTGVAVHDLHIVEKNREGTLTDYCLPRTVFDDLSSVMRAEAVGGRAYAILGTELVDITRLLPEGADPADMEGLVAGDIVYFEIDPNSNWGEYIQFRGAAWLDGIFPATLGYVVDVSADITYEDGIFTLSGIHLNGNE